MGHDKVRLCCVAALQGVLLDPLEVDQKAKELIPWIRLNELPDLEGAAGEEKGCSPTLGGISQLCRWYQGCAKLDVGQPRKSFLGF